MVEYLFHLFALHLDVIRPRSFRYPTRCCFTYLYPCEISQLFCSTAERHPGAQPHQTFLQPRSQFTPQQSQLSIEGGKGSPRIAGILRMPDLVLFLGCGGSLSSLLFGHETPVCFHTLNTALRPHSYSPTRWPVPDLPAFALSSSTIARQVHPLSLTRWP